MPTWRETAKNLLRTRHWMVFLAVTAAVHFGYALIHQIPPLVDARAYETIAINLIETGEYRLDSEGPLSQDGAIFKVGPGYEFFLAVVYSLTERARWVVWGLQAVGYVVTLFLVGTLVAAIWQRGEVRDWRKFYAVMTPAAFWMDMVQLNGMLMAESLWLCLAALSLVCFYEWRRQPDIWKAATTGAVTGFLYLVRPVAAAVILAVMAAMLLRRQWRAAGAVLLMAAALSAPWVYRNYQIYGEFLPTHTTAGGIDLLSGNYPGNHGEYRSDFAIYQEIYEKNPTPTGFAKAAKGWVVDFAINNPGQLFLIWLEKAVIFWSFTKTGGFWFHYFNNWEQAATVLGSVLAYGFLAGPGLAYGLAMMRRLAKNDGLEGVVWWSGVGLVMISVLTIISSRYRLTLLPFLMMLAAGFWWGLDSGERWRWGGVAGAWLLLATGLDLVLQYEKFLDRLGELNL